jgi:TM2 domain-containing membrane protein YozV
MDSVENKERTTALMLCFFLGGFGLHKKYLGYKNWWVYPVTIGGVFGIRPLMDFYKLIVKKLPDAQGRSLS